MLNIQTIQNRLMEIDKELKLLPKVKAGNPLQAVKWGLVCERRRLKIRLSRVNGKFHTLSDEFELIKSVGGKCVNCGTINNPSIDHIVAISRGGHDGIENLQVLCSSCNSKKGNRNAK